jgi:hypothetical protein
MTLARKLAAEAVANLAFDSEADYFVALASVQAAIGQAFELAAREVPRDKPLANRIRAIGDKPAKATT